MVNILSGGVRPGDFILSENEQVGARSRDNLTFKSGNTFKPGQVCGIITATGKVVPLDPAASDGSDDAAVLPVYAIDATAADVMGVGITREATVKEDGLIWPAGISAPNKAAAIAQLKALGIIIRPRSYVG
jgi:hypothetical protein